LRWGGGPQGAARAKEERLRALARDGTLAALVERCEEARRSMPASRAARSVVEGEGWKAFLDRYDRAAAERDLGWALDFWLGQREPVPERRYEKKCAACPFNAAGLCEYALAPADDRFRVERAADGTVLIHPRN
jgi:hypothetical protein